MNSFPSIERTITSQDMVAYAGATWDWHRLHHDADFARSKGVERPVVDGQMFGAMFAAHLFEHLGPDWAISEMEFRFVSMVLAGDTVTIASTPVEGSTNRFIQTVHVGERLCVTGETEVRRGN